LEQANLKRPAMLDVYEMLVDNKLIKDSNNYPTTPEDLKDLLEKQFNHG
jgi:cobalt/nickel transport system ATP-binding protein